MQTKIPLGLRDFKFNQHYSQNFQILSRYHEELLPTKSTKILLKYIKAFAQVLAISNQKMTYGIIDLGWDKIKGTCIQSLLEKI